MLSYISALIAVPDLIVPNIPHEIHTARFPLWSPRFLRESEVRLCDEAIADLTSKRQGILANTFTDPKSADFIAKVINLIEQGQSDEAVEMIRSLGSKKESITALRALFNHWC